MKYLLLLCFLLGLMSFKKKDQVIVLTAFTKQVDTLSKRGMSGVPIIEMGGLREVHPEVVKGREGWKDTRLYFIDTDFPQLLYQSYRQGKVTKEVCLDYFRRWGMDTSECSPLIVRGYTAMLEGTGEDGQLYIVADNNGNMDFSDDVPYLLSKKSLPMPLVFERIVAGEVRLDSIWVLPKKQAGNKDYIFWETRDMMTTHFTLEKREYVCTLRPGDDSYDKRTCEIEIRSSDTVVRCNLHEYLKLEGCYYRIDSIRNDGRYLCMRKEVNPAAIRSTQIGFPPLPFIATAIDGKLIHFPDDFKGKYVLLDFWATSCGPCIEEIRNTYPDLYAKYKEKGFEILGVTNDWQADIVDFRSKVALPWPVIADKENQRQIHKLYNVNGWPTLFLIGPDGKIVAKGHDLRGKKLMDYLSKIFE